MNFKEAKALLEKRNLFFTLPESGIEVEYRKPEFIKSAIKNNLPSFLTQAILSKMKTSLSGINEDPSVEKEFTDADVADLLGKSYMLLKDLSINPKFRDVENEQLEELNVNDVPDVDALAFLSNIVQSLQSVETAGGGRLTEEEIANFPKRKRRAERSQPSENL